MNLRRTQFTSLLSISVLLVASFACSNPLARFSKQYKCHISGKSDPQTAYEYVERGVEHIRANEFDCAFDACSEALRLDSRLPTAYACRGGVLSNRGDYLKALKDFDQALKLQPENGDFYYSRAQVYSRMDNTDAALADFAKAVEFINSEFGRSVAFSERAKIYQAQGKLDDSLKDYGEAIKLAPEFAYHYANRAAVYFEKQEYQKAIVDYSEAIRIDPRNPYFLSDRAKTYRALDQADLASEDEANAEALSNTSSPSSEAKPEQPDSTKISGGDLTNQAISLPKPPYPPVAKVARATGDVVVQVTIDEQGRVVTAHAVSGHPLLQAAAVNAARQARFEPRKLSGKPAKLTGTIRYSFANPQ